MGQFSWLDCKDKRRAIKCNVEKTAYVLVPDEFSNRFGSNGRIESYRYDGYGHFGGYDIFDLVALWNREYVCQNHINHLRPIKSRYKYKDGWERAKRRYEVAKNRLADFAKGTDVCIMKERYGNDYLRDIGIDIASPDECNASLKYPIKITYNSNAVYESCKPSCKDPDQGR